MTLVREYVCVDVLYYSSMSLTMYSSEPDATAATRKGRCFIFANIFDAMFVRALESQLLDAS